VTFLSLEWDGDVSEGDGMEWNFYAVVRIGKEYFMKEEFSRDGSVLFLFLNI